MSMLTDRQKATYSLIKKNSLEGNTTTQRQLFENYPISEHKDGYSWSTKPNSHDNCSQVWSDIVAINFSSDVDEIIIAKDFTYKIARNSQEATDFAKRYILSAKAKLSRYGAIIRKIKANGTSRLTELEEHLHFIDTFMEAEQWM